MASPRHSRLPGPRADVHQRPLPCSSCLSNLVYTGRCQLRKALPFGTMLELPVASPPLKLIRSPTPGSRRCSSCPVTVRGPLTGMHLPTPSCPPALMPEKVVLTALAIWDCQDTLTRQQQNAQRRTHMPPRRSIKQKFSLLEKVQQHLREQGAVRVKDLEKAEGPPTTRKRPRWRRRDLPRCGASADGSPRRDQTGGRTGPGHGACGLAPRPRLLPGLRRGRLRKGLRKEMQTSW